MLSRCNSPLSCAPGELSQHGSKHKEDVSVLQQSIAALDREKDVLQDEVDQKTERMFVLEEENSKKVALAALLVFKNEPSALLHSDRQKRRFPFHLV